VRAIMIISRVNTKGELTIPKELRKRFNIKARACLGFVEEGGKVTLQIVEKGYFLRYAGILGTNGEILKGLIRDKAK
jgi:AbrB family looped-hinge helix DNA binding protein